MAGCRYTTLRIILIVFSIIFWLAGATLLGIGIWFLVDTNSVSLLNVAISDDALLRAAAIIIVVVGSVMIVIGFLGCCGSCCENATCLFIFASVLVILVMGQVATGILVGIYYDPLVNSVSEMMNETLKNHYFGSWASTPETVAWDQLQVEFSCCGVAGPSDWVGSWWHTNLTNGTEPTWPVPATCCVLINSDHKNPIPLNSSLCSVAASNLSANHREIYLHTQGCEAKFHHWVSSHLAIIIGVAIGLIAIQVFEIIVSCCLALEIRNKGTIY